MFVGVLDTTLGSPSSEMDVLTNKKLISRNNTSQCNYVSTKIIHVYLPKIYQSKKQKPTHNTTSQQQKLWNKKKIV